jgi:hypothetical protein
MGTLSMELGGHVTIACEKTGYTAEMEFKLKVSVQEMNYRRIESLDTSLDTLRLNLLRVFSLVPTTSTEFLEKSSLGEKPWLQLMGIGIARLCSRTNVLP